MPRVVAYVDDLFFQMKLAETAKHLHIEVKVATSPDALLQLMDPLPKFVIVDLNARNMPLQAVRQLREQHRRRRRVRGRTRLRDRRVHAQRHDRRHPHEGGRPADRNPRRLRPGRPQLLVARRANVNR